MSWQSRDTSIMPTSRWQSIMRKFSEPMKPLGIPFVHSISMDIPRVNRSKKHFPTGSQYRGTWDMLGMSGYGVYTFPNGVKYEGQFDDGVFNGHGELKYPTGVIIRGKWKRGELIHKTLIFDDGLVYRGYDWGYCQVPNRRFGTEYNDGVKPAGCSLLTAEEPTRVIPPGYYDTGDGFYDPKTKFIYWPDDLTAIIRSPSPQEQRWIIENCRSSADTSIGPRINLYETWSEPYLALKPTMSSFTDLLLQSQVLMESSSSHAFHRKSSIWWNPVLNFRDIY